MLCGKIARMNREIPSNLTAEAWLAHAGMNHLGESLARIEVNFGNIPEGSVVGDTLYARGGTVRDQFLAPGEFTRLIGILESSYPQVFHSWLEKELLIISSFVANGWTEEGLKRARMTRHYHELRDSFSKCEQFSSLEQFIEWI